MVIINDHRQLVSRVRKARKDDFMPAKTVSVKATLGGDFTMEAPVGSHRMYVDQPTEAMGKDKGPSPLQYLMLSLAGCMGAIARIIANQKKLPLNGLEVEVEGPINTDKLLGKESDQRVGFTNFTMRLKVDADMSAEEKEAFIREVESRCPVSDNLSNATQVTIESVE
jgi:uncharacterized OsmC-like protein